MNIIGDVKDKNVILLDDMIDTQEQYVMLLMHLKNLVLKKFTLVVHMQYYQVQQ